MKSIKILGVDPSMRHFGYASATYENDGIFVHNIWQQDTKPKPKDYKGYKNVWDLEQAGKLALSFHNSLILNPDIIMVEMPVGSQSAAAMCSYGVCLGVVALAKLREIPVVIVRAKDVKLLATGNPHAEKKEVIEEANRLYPHLNWNKRKSGEILLTNEHMADAVWTIRQGCLSNQFIEFKDSFK